MTSAKQRAAEAALAYLKPDTVLGVGTGSTVNFSSTPWPRTATAFQARCPHPTPAPSV